MAGGNGGNGKERCRIKSIGKLWDFVSPCNANIKCNVTLLVLLVPAAVQYVHSHSHTIYNRFDFTQHSIEWRPREPSSRPEPFENETTVPSGEWNFVADGTGRSSACGGYEWDGGWNADYRYTPTWQWQKGVALKHLTVFG